MILRLTSHLGEESKVVSPLSHWKANPDQNQKKKKMGKIQGVTNLPPLKKSRPRDLVAQGSNMNIPTWGNHFQHGFPFCLYILFPLDLSVSLPGCGVVCFTEFFFWQILPHRLLRLYSFCVCYPIWG
jgi:hypothetical protein